MITEYLNTDVLFTKIRSGKTGRDEVLSYLYKDDKLRASIATMVYKNGGDDHDAKTTFNTSLVVFVKKVVEQRDFEISTSLNGYIYGIARFTWLNELRKKPNSTVEIEKGFDLGTEVTPEKLLIDENRIEILQDLLGILGKNCREVLMHWANGYSMKEISSMMNYKSEMMARKKKYTCFKQLLDYLEKHPNIKEVLR